MVETALPHLNAIQPTEVRFIKLGRGSAWAQQCFDNAQLRIGEPNEPIDLYFRQDWQGAIEHLREVQSKDAGTAKRIVGEFQAFSTLPEDSLWITIVNGTLWWTLAMAPDTVKLRGKAAEDGALVRRTKGWHRTDIYGRPLSVDRLSGALTAVAGTQNTICRVKTADGLVQKINGVTNPAVENAEAALDQAAQAAKALITSLSWGDFELLTELIFQRSGWQRVSGLGGKQAVVDLVLEQPATRERAMVQVKSASDIVEFKRYEAIFAAGSFDRFFFVCHSPRSELIPADKRATVWTLPEVARRAIETGLLSWLTERAR